LAEKSEGHRTTEEARIEMDKVSTALTVGVGGMVVGKASEEPTPRHDIMQLDVLMGLGGDFYLTLGGLLIILGSAVAIYGGYISHQRSKEQKRREDD